ncbi:MAG: hypothetical protein MK212_01055, partial [Saprospiraceae bacterium]|nr:hypothetical protein [Saprospiraceae bacterium]
MNIRKLVLYTFFVAIVSLPQYISAQLIRTDYGQNRLQHNPKEKWYRYESPNFAISFAEDQEELAEFVVPTAERDYFELKALLEYQVKKRMELVIFGDYSDYVQSNIGLVSPSINAGGGTKIMDNKILIYFNGDHTDLERQIREGIARVLINRMLTGSNLQEIVQNSVLLHLPEWFTEGAVAYATEEWNIEQDDALREAFLSGKYKHFVDFAQQHPRLAGHSLFHFVGRKHGASYVSNLLYLTRINRSVENGFLYVFGSSFYTVAGGDWLSYFNERYAADNVSRRFPSKGELTINTNKNVKINQLKISPNGKYVLYVEHLRGESKVFLHKVTDDERKVVWKTGVKGYDNDYNTESPLLAWDKSSQHFYIAHHKNDRAFIQKFSASGKAMGKNNFINDIESITSLEFSGGSTFLLTAIDEGQSDVYKYNMSTKSLSSLTNDLWDDKSVVSVKMNGKRGVIFASNRQGTNLAQPSTAETDLIHNFDLYFLDLENPKAELIQLTRTAHISEYAPSRLTDSTFTYLSAVTGITNRYIARLDSIIINYEKVIYLANGSTLVVAKDSSLKDDFDAEEIDSTVLRPVRVLSSVAHANTDYSRNIQEHHSAYQSKKIADLLYRDGTYHIFVRQLNADRKFEPVPSQYVSFLEKDYGITEVEIPLEVKEIVAESKDGSLDEEKADLLLAKELELVEAEMSTTTLGDTSKPIKTKEPLSDTSKVDIDNYLFQSEFDDIEEPKAKPNTDENSIAEDTSKPRDVGPRILIDDGDGNISRLPPKVRKPKKNPRLSNLTFKPVTYDASDKNKYRNLFKVDEITFQLDNSILFNGMDMYLGGYYRFPPVGLLFKTSFMDVFENYRLEIGARLPTSFNGMEYFVTFENRKGRLDQKYGLYRRGRVDDVFLVDTVSNLTYGVKGRNLKHLVQAELKYPLNRYHSVRATPTLQFDRIAILAEEPISLDVPVYNEARLGLRLEYVFDNTVDLRVNIKKGTRYKVYADLFKPFNVQTSDEFRVNFDGGLTSAFGFDVRHYLSLADKGVLALRAAGATSFGQQKMLYSMGGMENWIFPSSNQNMPLPDQNAFAYQVAVGNMRGFSNNIRNGSSFALINAELRIPVMEYISRTPPRNLFLRNLQLTAFYDVGTAWQGLNPFDPDNPLNTTIIDTGNDPNSFSPVRVKVKYYRKPIVMGFGVGLRTIILGYYVRLDYAWGLETGQLQT